MKYVMENSANHPPSKQNIKDPSKAIVDRPNEAKPPPPPPSAQPKDENYQQQPENETTNLFRACDAKTIELNGPRKFSENFHFDRSRVGTLTPLLAKGETSRREVVSKAGGGVGAEAEGASHGANEDFCHHSAGGVAGGREEQSPGFSTSIVISIDDGGDLMAWYCVRGRSCFVLRGELWGICALEETTVWMLRFGGRA